MGDIFTMTGNTRRQTMRAAPSAFIQSRLRGVIEHSDRANASHPAEVFMPFKYLPVMMVDPSTDDGYVLNKGSIVSLITAKTAAGQRKGFGEPSESASIYIAIDNTGTGVITADIDDSFFGYSNHIAGLLVLANGGQDVDPEATGATATISIDQYTSYDTGRTMKYTGTAVNIGVGEANQSVGYTRVANYPIGIVTADVYQDIRGKNLNYDQPTMHTVGIMCRGLIEIPFLDMYAAANSGYDDTNLPTALLSGSAGADTAIAGTLQPNATWYTTVVRKHAFLYNPETDANLLISGSLLKSDRHGRFVPEWAALTSMGTFNAAWSPVQAWSDVTAVDQPFQTAQTVGKLLVTDSRWPKDLQQWVATYPGSEMPGSETAGLPSMIWNFAKDVLTASGWSSGPTRKQILDMVQSGIFGSARILLTIA